MGKRSVEYIYGVNPAFEVIRSGRRKVSAAFLNESSRDSKRMRTLRAQLERHEIPIEWVDKGRVHQLAGSKDHQGVVLKTGTYPYTPFEEVLGRQRLLLLDNVEDPHNLGAILRSAEIFGFKSVLLPTKGVPEVYPSVVKVSAGATEFLDIVRDRNANKYAQIALDAGYNIVVLDAKGDIAVGSLAADDLAPLFLVIGGEDRPVGQYIINNAYRVARIEQHGRINSLNASVAASIAMFALAQ
jgi:23S rRNA (guanosine2251-2'-O)-methyltransferase